MFRKTFVRENCFDWGFRQFNRAAFEKFFRGGQKFLQFDIFSRDADCQLGGGPQENVSIVSARGGGVPKWAFLASADM